MNERIKELAKQAGFDSGVAINIGTNTATEMWYHYNEEADNEEMPTTEMMEKFAKLIIQDCVDILSDYSGKVVFDDYGTQMLQHPIVRIKQNFGIEQ